MDSMPSTPSRAAAWLRITRSLDGLSGGEELHRGIEAAERTCADWPDHDRAAPGHWLRRVFDGGSEPRLRVTRALDLLLHDQDVPGDRLAWCDAPDLAHLTVLRVLDARLGDGGLDRWLGSSGHGRLRHLGLGSRITAEGAASLARDRRLRGVERLALFRNDIGAAGVSALLTSEHLRGTLKQLLLGRNGLGRAGARALADGSAGWTGLELLDLDADRLDGHCVESLATSPLLHGVRWLNLSNNAIGRRGCRALARCRTLGSLEQLFLHGCGLGDDETADLLRAPWLAGLKNLALSGNRLSMRSVRLIAGRRDLTLSELDVCHNAFTELEATAVLCAAPQMAGLRRLCA